MKETIFGAGVLAFMGVAALYAIVRTLVIAIAGCGDNDEMLTLNIHTGIIGGLFWFIAMFFLYYDILKLNLKYESIPLSFVVGGVSVGWSQIIERFIPI